MKLECFFGSLSSLANYGITPEKLSDLEARSFSDNERWSASLLEDTLALDTSWLGIALKDKQLIGYLLVSIVHPESELLRIAVVEDMQGRGYGEIFLKRCYEELKRRGIQTLDLEVSSNNAPALALYKKLDFQSVGKRVAYYESDGSDALLMRR